MKKLAAILCLTGLAVGAFAQGTVNFFNSPSTLISQGPASAQVAISGPVGSWYFGLATAPAGTVNPTAFTFAGVYGTNQTSAGRFSGGVAAIPGWAPGTTRSFLVVGWDASLGTTFQSAWLAGNTAGTGISGIGQASPGGFNAGTGGTDPNPFVFGAATIPSGFNISPVPEPTTFALAGLGAAAMLILRRRK